MTIIINLATAANSHKNPCKNHLRGEKQHQQQLKQQHEQYWYYFLETAKQITKTPSPPAATITLGHLSSA